MFLLSKESPPCFSVCVTVLMATGEGQGSVDGQIFSVFPCGPHFCGSDSVACDALHRKNLSGFGHLALKS